MRVAKLILVVEPGTGRTSKLLLIQQKVILVTVYIMPLLSKNGPLGHHVTQVGFFKLRGTHILAGISAPGSGQRT